MERRSALAVAGAVTVLLGTSIVGAAALGGLGLLGFSRSEASGIGTFTPSPTTAPAQVQIRTRDIYDPQIVDDPTTTSVAPVASRASGTEDPAGVAPSEHAVDDAHAGANDEPSPTTAPAATATTHGHEEDGDNGPTGTTVPPPANCTQPRWEDGHWECGGDD